MNTFLRWILILIGALVAGVVCIVIYLGLTSGKMSTGFWLIVCLILWVATWIGSGYLLKKQNVKQPYAVGFLVALFTSSLIISGAKKIFPSEEELKARATSAEEEYFILSNGSLDHNRICKAAYNAYNNYKKLNDTDKTKLFEYIIVQDKCL